MYHLNDITKQVINCNGSCRSNYRVANMHIMNQAMTDDVPCKLAIHAQLDIYHYVIHIDSQIIAML
jgi:hypothetical protein